MPKSINKGKRRKGTATTSNAGAKQKSSDSNDDNDVDDAMSDVTQMSLDDDGTASVYADSVMTESRDPVDQIVSLEDKLKEYLDNATNKNTGVRLDALKNLQTLLSTHYLPEFLENWKVTVSDVIERSLRKGSSSESRIAVKLISLLAIQLGLDSAESVSKLVGLLKQWTSDPTLAPDYRADCATALSVCTFVTEEELDTIVAALDAYHEIWVHTKVHCTPETSPLFCATVNAWVLLLLQVPNRYLSTALNQDLGRLCEYLESTQVDVRIAAGEALAVLYELAGELYSDGFRPPTHQKTLEMLQQMSHDSSKHHNKRDRRVQRASFREIFAAVKENFAPNLKVKFGSENLILDSWSSKLCYDLFCGVLSGGVVCHLRENSLLREIFGLGPPSINGGRTKMPKIERQMINNTINKARSLVRGKQRDKRVATFS